MVRGVTEELTRESIVVVAPSAETLKWLKPATNVFIAVELPFAGAVEPRVLECAASILRVRVFSNKVRIVAEIQRMTVIKRDPELPTSDVGSHRTGKRSATHSCATGMVTAVTRSQNDDPVILMNHSTQFKSNSTGEHTMSFLKNFFIEEEGQDMVEYGLVIALLIVGASVGYATFFNSINNALNTLAGNITNKF
jgi:Flp pilus assembly pilin Flp